MAPEGGDADSAGTGPDANQNVGPFEAQSRGRLPPAGPAARLIKGRVLVNLCWLS